MKKRYILFLLIGFAVVYLIYSKYKDESRPLAEVDASDSEEEVVKVETQKKSEEVIKKQLVESQAINDKATSPAQTPDQMEDVEKAFSTHLRQLGECLGVESSVNAEKLTPSAENLIDTLKTSFGEVVVKMDDWSQVDLQNDDGTVSRIRTEVEYTDSSSPTRRVQLYKVNNQDMPELQPLTAEQSVNPTDEALEKLRGSAKPIIDEKGSRIYYPNGEELVLVERGGKVQSYSLTKGEKTFTCTDSDSSSSTCQCLQ